MRRLRRCQTKDQLLSIMVFDHQESTRNSPFDTLIHGIIFGVIGVVSVLNRRTMLGKEPISDD